MKEFNSWLVYHLLPSVIGCTLGVGIVTLMFYWGTS